MVYRTKLDDIGRKFGTDKSSDIHNYLNFYEERLSYLRDEDFLLYEVGVLNGSSLKTWGEFFPKATIVGLDITAEAKQYENGNCHVHIGDATRLDVIDEVITKYGSPFIVIDDGSHVWQHQIDAFKNFWPKVLKGGMFIMEDLHTSFVDFLSIHPYYKGDTDISAYEYLSNLNKHVCARGFISQEPPLDDFIGKNSSTVRSIEWYPSTCIIRKSP